MKKGYYSAKRRGIMAQGEEINHTEVFDEYDWICYVCGGKIDRHAGKNDWMRVTLEHIKPISMGGTHTRDNVAPSHWKCNMERGNDYTEDDEDVQQVQD